MKALLIIALATAASVPHQVKTAPSYPKLGLSQAECERRYGEDFQRIDACMQVDPKNISQEQRDNLALCIALRDEARKRGFKMKAASFQKTGKPTSACQFQEPN